MAAVHTPVAILVGAPGAGKSTVGRRVAEKFHLPFVDTDQFIEEQSGSSVADIFITEGESEFRAREVAAVEVALSTCIGIVSLGGGAITQAATRELLEGKRVIWLKVSASEAARRVGMSGARPLLMGNVRGTLQKLLAEREQWYEQVSTDIVETSDRSLKDIVDDVAHLLEKSL
jgi:shikimate kinase